MCSGGSRSPSVPRTATTTKSSTPRTTRPPRQPRASTRNWAKGPGADTSPRPRRQSRWPDPCWIGTILRPDLARGRTRAPPGRDPEQTKGQVHLRQGLDTARQEVGQSDKHCAEQVKSLQAEAAGEGSGHRSAETHEKHAEGIGPGQAGAVPGKLPQHLDVKDAEHAAAREPEHSEQTGGDYDDPAVGHTALP